MIVFLIVGEYSKKRVCSRLESIKLHRRSSIRKYAMEIQFGFFIFKVEVLSKFSKKIIIMKPSSWEK